MTKHHRGIVVSLPRLVIALALLVGAGLAFTPSRQSSAATTYNHSPIGLVDSCHLSGTGSAQTTVLVGWAFDPEGGAGPQPYVNVTVNGVTDKVASSISGYHDTGVNNYLAANDPGAPTNSVYGWTASFSNLYKGHTYPVSGTVLNAPGSAGSNSALGVWTKSNDQVPFSNKNIPDACLTTAPAPPPPPPSGGGSTGSTGSTNTTKSSTSKGTGTGNTGTSTPTPAPANSADAKVTAGTAAAGVAVPTDGATSVHLVYNTAALPAVTTSDIAINGDSTTISLSGLQALTKYSFQIVRTNSTGSSTSDAANFTTLGYTATAQFTSHGKAVSGITGTIDDDKSSKATSDSTGAMTFKNLADGYYTVNYSYHGHAYSSTFNTANITTDQAASTDAITLTNAINVDKLSVPSAKAKHSGSNGFLVVVLVLFILVVVGFGLWFLLRFIKNRRLESEYGALATPVSSGTDIIDQKSVQEFSKHQPAPQPLPAHAGESLRDMVLESMRTQAPQPAASGVVTPGGSSVAERSAALPPQPSTVTAWPPLPPAAPAPAAPNTSLPPVPPAPAQTPAQPTPNQLPPVAPSGQEQTIDIPHDR